MDSTYYTIGNDFYGIQYHSNTYNNANAIGKLDKLNLKRIRIWAHVSDFHPDSATWNWNDLDQKITEITNLNYKPIVCIDECKEWFIDTPEDPWWNYSKGITEWEEAIYQFTNRYKDDLNMIIIFDEPNCMYSENEYYIPFQDAAQLYIKAVAQIRNVDSTILCGGPSSFGGWENGRFAEYVLDEPNGNEYLDFISCNIFLSWNYEEETDTIMSKTIWYEEAPMKIREMLGIETPPMLILDADNFSALWTNGTDPRNTSYIGGIYNITTLLHSAKGGFDIALRWETLGGFGILSWYPNFNLLPPYYAMDFLINYAGLIPNSQIIKCTTTESPIINAPHHGGMNAALYKIQPFAIKRIDGGISTILINKYSLENMTAIVNVPNEMQSYSLFRYDSTRIEDCNNPIIEENVTDTLGVNCPKHSVTLIKFSPERVSKIKDNTPKKYTIKQNYPNPFNTSTKIEYSYQYDFKIKISIYNILGKKVITLVDERKLAGNYQVTWNGKNSDGEIVPSGIYFYKTELDNVTKLMKMVFVK